MMNHIAWISFTPRGRALAEKLCEAMGGTAEDARREGFSLSDWTERAFSEAQALVFVGAAGICVRAIAPFLRNKTEDPAVICLDEAGHFVIPLLSGHLGGANDLAREMARQCGATPVITTATDVNHLFAVDLLPSPAHGRLPESRRSLSLLARQRMYPSPYAGSRRTCSPWCRVRLFWGSVAGRGSPGSSWRMFFSSSVRRELSIPRRSVP